MKTAILGLDLQTADDFIKVSNINTMRGIPLPKQIVDSRTLSLTDNVPVTLPGNRDAALTVIIAEKPIKVSAILNNSPVDFPVSIAPIVLPGSVTNIAITSTHDEPVNVFVLQGA